MRIVLPPLALILAALAVLAAPAALAAPRPSPAPPKPDPKPPEPKTPEAGPSDPKAPDQLQKEADRHFKSGVALFKEAKYADALTEFQRAYEIAPHPLVLYNIAGCHRELAHYAEAISYYNRFIAEGSGKVPAARLSAAQVDLDAIFALIARVTVTITPSGEAATLIVDDTPLDKPVMPLILVPGEHRLIARAAGRRDSTRTLTVAAGEKVVFELPLGDSPATSIGKVGTVDQVVSPIEAPAARPWLAVDAGFGMNLRRVGKTGAPSIGLGAELGSRVGVGVDVVLVAYAVIPSVRVRLVGDALSLHVVGAVPVSFSDDPMTGTFIAVAGGLGLRYRAMPRLTFRLESYVSIPTKNQLTTVPTFLGGELWF
jgi:hypothetical protein